MKTLIIPFLLVLGAAIGHAQKITVLEEAKVTIAPQQAITIQDGESYIFLVNEAYKGEFAKNRIAFMKNHFDIHEFIAQLTDKTRDTYWVTFKSTNGALTADFDKAGNLVRTSQNFKDVVLPVEIMRDLYTSHKGWTVMSNKYKATTKGDILSKETYRISLENGKSKQNLKIDGLNRNLGVASN